jgi:GNAT superfamily N-acetyltransferase
VALFAVVAAARGRGVGDLLWRTAVEALRARGPARPPLGRRPRALAPGRAGRRAGRHLALPARPRRPPRRPRVRSLARPPRPGDRRRPHPGRGDPRRRRSGRGRRVRRAGLPRSLGRRGGPLRGVRLRRPRPAPGRCDGRLLRRGPTRRSRPRPRPPLDGWPGGAPDPGVAALGPLGLDPAARGGGLGLALVAGAARWQREHGHRAAVIDWTTLTDFYGRLGAHAWRVYQRAEGDL